jgi:hypothetical protein
MLSRRQTADRFLPASRLQLLSASGLISKLPPPRLRIFLAHQDFLLVALS